MKTNDSELLKMFTVINICAKTIERGNLAEVRVESHLQSLQINIFVTCGRNLATLQYEKNGRAMRKHARYIFMIKNS